MGDHLILSTLPERFARLGKKVYLSSHRYRTRNAEQTKLIWEMNPFVEGFIDEEPNAGYARLGPFWERVTWSPPDPIAHSEAAHDLPGPYNHFPKIYRTHRWMPELYNTVLMDCSSNSVPFSEESVRNYYNQHLRHPYRQAEFRAVNFTHLFSHHRPRVPGMQTIDVPDIFTYCDMIYSCRVFAGVEAGGSILALTIKNSSPQPIVHTLMSTYTANARMFTFPGVLYSYDQSSFHGHYQEPKPELDQYLNTKGTPRNMT
jgi:hypothetical protein